jgi:hypothetical protein
MSRYELGQFDKAAYDHGMSVVQEMRDVTGVKGGDTHFVVIAVYADGYLQFAGADAAVNVHIDRLAAKQQAMLILGRMESPGEIDISKAPLPSENKIELLDRAIGGMRYEPIPKHRTDHELLMQYADRIEKASDNEVKRIERIVRDAIIGYQDLYASAPNDDTERELKERATVANEWLVSHGFEAEKTIWDKEESPCL